MAGSHSRRPAKPFPQPSSGSSAARAQRCSSARSGGFSRAARTAARSGALSPAKPRRTAASRQRPARFAPSGPCSRLRSAARSASLTNTTSRTAPKGGATSRESRSCPARSTRPRGPAKILGWSLLDQFPKELKEDIDRDRGLAYLQSAKFEPLGLSNALSFLKDLIADQDGTIRKDMRIADAEPDLTKRRIEERVVPVGSRVTVLGIWSEAQRGFAPASSAAMNRLYPTDPVLLLKDLRAASVKTLGVAVVFFIVLHAILVPMFLLAPGS